MRGTAITKMQTGQVVQATPGRSRLRALSPWWVGGGVVLLVAAVIVSVTTIDDDSGTKLVGLTREVGDALTHLRWQFAGIVVALGALHYVATAVAARAAAGIAAPLGEMVLVQLAAAAANRVTPAGLGGSALTVRYLTRRGLAVPAALGAALALAVGSGVASLLTLAALILVGSWFGVHRTTHELSLLLNHVSERLGTVRSPWLWLAIAVIGATAAALYLSERGTRLLGQGASALGSVRALIACPRRLWTVLIASASTTVVLGLAFVATTAMVPGTRPDASLVALLVAYLLGSAVGSAVPIPAGLGAAEAALIAVLTNLDVPATQAVEEVVLFRLITFWAPAAVGVLATRYLRRVQVL
jgi:uncharacterized membrane protein YbhN (UPF0104 family)